MRSQSVDKPAYVSAVMFERYHKARLNHELVVGIETRLVLFKTVTHQGNFSKGTEELVSRD